MKNSLALARETSAFLISDKTFWSWDEAKTRTKKKKLTFQYVILETLEILFERWAQQWMDDDDEEINYKWSEKHEQRGKLCWD